MTFFRADDWHCIFLRFVLDIGDSPLCPFSLSVVEAVKGPPDVEVVVVVVVVEVVVVGPLVDSESSAASCLHILDITGV